MAKVILITVATLVGSLIWVATARERAPRVSLETSAALAAAGSVNRVATAAAPLSPELAGWPSEGSEAMVRPVAVLSAAPAEDWAVQEKPIAAAVAPGTTRAERPKREWSRQWRKQDFQPQQRLIRRTQGRLPRKQP